LRVWKELSESIRGTILSVDARLGIVPVLAILENFIVQVTLR
jgi:hypothetical protein